MSGAEGEEGRGDAGEDEREQDRLEQDRDRAVRVRIDPRDGTYVERGRDAHSADLRQRGRDEDHPAEDHEDAQVREERRGEHAGEERLAPQLAAGPELREPAQWPPFVSGAGSRRPFSPFVEAPMTIATCPSTRATRTSRP